MAFRTYDPSEVSVSFKGVNITGFMDGTFIDAEREEDAFTKHVGATGDVTRTKNLNRTGKVTITLMAASSSNDALMALHAADDLLGLSFGPLQIIDHNGNMHCRATEAWIMRVPKTERAKESGNCVWIFECARLEIVQGGNVF